MASAVLPLQSLAEVDANRNEEIYFGSIVLIVLPTVFVVLRLLSRWMARAKLWVSPHVEYEYKTTELKGDSGTTTPLFSHCSSRGDRTSWP